MLIRWKKWNQSLTGKKFSDPRGSFFFSKDNEGICDVKNKSIIDRMLNSINPEFEPVWEDLGVYFDEKGIQITKEEIEDRVSTSAVSIENKVFSGSTESSVVHTESTDNVEVHVEKKQKRRGRPRKNK